MVGRPAPLKLGAIAIGFMTVFASMTASAKELKVGLLVPYSGVYAALGKEIDAAVADPGIAARLADLGGTVLPAGSPAEFGAFIAAETEKWAKVVQFAGIKPE